MTDLIILDARDKRIAARVRRHGYFDLYGGQFTIRSHRDSGAKTEMSKIIGGCGDWLFYGHANQAETNIEHWMVVDLDAFRAALILEARERTLRFEKCSNDDGTYFVSYDAMSFPPYPPILVASNHAGPAAAKCVPAAVHSISAIAEV